MEVKVIEPEVLYLGYLSQLCHLALGQVTYHSASVSSSIEMVIIEPTYRLLRELAQLICVKCLDLGRAQRKPCM